MHGEADREKCLRLVETDRSRVAANIQSTDRDLIQTSAATADLQKVLV